LRENLKSRFIPGSGLASRPLVPNCYFGRRLPRFRRDQNGGAAVEFALLAVPFLVLLIAIFETALLFLAGQVLETGVAETARMIRTGQAQHSEFDREDFRQAICDASVVLISCQGKLTVDVRTAESFSAADLTAPIVDGKLDGENFVFEPGNGSDIVVVRAFFEWPTFMRAFGQDFSTLANGNHLLSATAAFRNEPFP
jgi:Flp pilus assembly protein TadG